MKSMLNSVTRAGLGAMVATSLFLTGCGDEVIIEPVNNTGNCQELIAKKDFSKALKAGRDAAAKNAADADAHYCIALANVGTLISSVNGIVGVVSSLGAPQNGMQPSAQDLKGLVGSFLEPIQASMREFDREAFILAGLDNPTYQIDSFPLPLDVEAILGLLGDEAPVIEGEAVFDVGGTWTLAEIHLLAAAFNGVQGLLDYVMAHELVVSKLELPELSTEGLAGFLVKNPDLLTLASSTEDQARLTGNDVHKGVKNAVLSVLSYLVGRDAELAKVAPANDGAIAAIQANAALSADDKVIAWSVNADGYPNGVKIRMIETLNKNATIKTADGEPVEIDSEYSFEIEKAVWESFVKLGEDLRDNIEADGASVGIKSLLEVLKATYGDDLTEGAISRLISKEIPDLVYLNPGAFFENPLVVRDMLPTYFGFVTEAEATMQYDLGIEFEMYGDGTTITVERLGVNTVETGDAWHFYYSDPVSYNVHDIDDTLTPYTELDADGLAPSASSPLFTYISLQSPSFGGLLEVLFEGETAPAAADSLSFNYGLNWLVDYYCLDMNKGLDAFDNANYAAACE